MSQNIWNPWHGCTKKSEGCRHCYMYYLDSQRDRDGSVFHINKTSLDAPLKKDRQKAYKITPGSRVRVCMTSDFFYEKADPWREQAWDVIRKRPDVIFYLLTKRPERFGQCLPGDWRDGYENVQLGITVENQACADERLPLLIRTPAKHKAVNVAPFIGPIRLARYLAQDRSIEDVGMGGENYDGCRPLYDEWVKDLFNECVAYGVRCYLYETGTLYIRDGKTFYNKSHSVQAAYARSSPYRYFGRTPVYRLFDPETGRPLTEADVSEPIFTKHCLNCPTLETCTGCTGCKNCGYDRSIIIKNRPAPYRLAGH